MGNKICCDDYRQDTNPFDNAEAIQIVKEPRKVQHRPQQPQVIKEDKIIVPGLFPHVKQTLEKHQFFREQWEQTKPHVRQYGNEIYEGQIQDLHQKPNGFGRLHKSDGSLFIGHFALGKAQSNGAYIFPDGSYFIGGFQNNSANCIDGYYESEQLKYSGGFKNNLFHGKGKEESSNHTFEGSYLNGKKQRGTFKWKEDKDNWATYEGTLNQHDQFHGKGILTEVKGKYEGDFINGKKQGKGVYITSIGVKYEGQYKNDMKNGFGIIYSPDGTIAYEGELANGMPHGKGKVYINGVGVPSELENGVNVLSIGKTE